MIKRFKGAQIIIVGLLLLLMAFGVWVRFYRITESQFFYYDEGLWLNNNRAFVSLVSENLPKNFFELTRIISISWHMSLATAKSLWAFLSNLRGLIVGEEGWYFVRLISAIFGTLSLGIVYLFARDYYQSRWTGLLAAALLAVFPSHIYYSRCGLQEAFSTFCFLAGLYFYFFPRKLSAKTFLSAGLFACVFLSNYRMIIIPFLTGFCEVFICLSKKKRLDLRKYIYNTLAFLFLIFMIGNIDDGANTKITFAWMFHQIHLAKGHFDILNLFSYPYYLFRLESIPFGLLFFGNIYFIVKRQWARLFPFALVCFVMVLFSFSQEKGVRYLCAVMPFMVMAPAALLVFLWEEKRHRVAFRWGIIGVTVVMFSCHVVKANTISHFQSDYQSAIQEAWERNPTAKVLSTQFMVQKLYAAPQQSVRPPPHQLKALLSLYLQGYRYLMIGPQAYVSYTADGYRFSSELEGYLHFIQENVKPVKTYAHFNKALLERFVLEHNENLGRSLKFLNSNKDGNLGALRVYDVQQCLAVIRKDMVKNDK